MWQEDIMSIVEELGSTDVIQNEEQQLSLPTVWELDKGVVFGKNVNDDTLWNFHCPDSKDTGCTNLVGC